MFEAVKNSEEAVKARREQNEMSIESMICLVVAALLMVYLICALLRPERF